MQKISQIKNAPEKIKNLLKAIMICKYKKKPNKYYIKKQKKLNKTKFQIIMTLIPINKKIMKILVSLITPSMIKTKRSKAIAIQRSTLIQRILNNRLTIMPQMFKILHLLPLVLRPRDVTWIFKNLKKYHHHHSLKRKSIHLSLFRNQKEKIAIIEAVAKTQMVRQLCKLQFLWITSL